MNKYRIKIERDDWSENPFEAWDCEPELIYRYERNDVNDCSNGRIVKFIKDFPTNGQIIKHQVTLCDILEIDHDYLCERELTKDEKADEIRWEIDDSLSIEQLVDLCELFNIHHSHHESIGYSQRDWAEVLLVLTDDFYERTGCDRNRYEEILEGSRKLFDAWAWGDVYRFEVEEATEIVKLTREDFNASRFEGVEDEIEWDHYDGCGGFYGEDIDGIAENSGVSKEIVEKAFYYENRGKWIEFEM